MALLLKLLIFLGGVSLGASSVVAIPPSSDNDDGIVHYDGYRVIRTTPTTPNQLTLLSLLASSGLYDFWQEPKKLIDDGGFADIMTSPDQYPEVLQFLNSHQIPHRDMITDLEHLLSTERARHLNRRPLTQGQMDWEDYHTWEEVDGWLANLTQANSLITREQYGTSFEGRPLHVYKLSAGANSNITRPAFWIDATIHAREHITTSVITYVINQLVTNSTNSNLLNSIDFYFAPFINPDGYVYTFTNDRLFRRTRSNWTNNTCVGVDANRNFGFQFGGPGSSSSPCSETYRGPAAYSEPETRGVRDYIIGKAQENVNWTGFITLHSYSQLWMSPYGYTETPTEDYEELKSVGDEAAEAIRGHFGTRYTVGNAGAILYLSSGSSRDWAKGEAGFKWVYTIELRDTGAYGFLLPPDQILDTCVETWSGIQVVARKMIE